MYEVNARMDGSMLSYVMLCYIMHAVCMHNIEPERLKVKPRVEYATPNPKFH